MIDTKQYSSCIEFCSANQMLLQQLNSTENTEMDVNALSLSCITALYKAEAFMHLQQYDVSE